MGDQFEVMFKTQEEMRKDIIKDFATDFMEEIQKLIEEYGREELMKILKK